MSDTDIDNEKLYASQAQSSSDYVFKTNYEVRDRIWAYCGRLGASLGQIPLHGSFSQRQKNLATWTGNGFLHGQ